MPVKEKYRDCQHEHALTMLNPCSQLSGVHCVNLSYRMQQRTKDRQQEIHVINKARKSVYIYIYIYTCIYIYMYVFITILHIYIYISI